MKASRSKFGAAALSFLVAASFLPVMPASAVFAAETQPAASEETSAAETAPAKEKTVKDTAKTIKPDQVKKVKLTRKSATSVKVSWASAKRATGYVVYLKRAGHKYHVYAKTKKHSCVVKNMKHGRTYLIAVKSYRKYQGKTYYGKLSKARRRYVRSNETPNKTVAFMNGKSASDYLHGDGKVDYVVTYSLKRDSSMWFDGVYYRKSPYKMVRGTNRFYSSNEHVAAFLAAGGGEPSVFSQTLFLKHTGTTYITCEVKGHRARMKVIVKK